VGNAFYCSCGTGKGRVPDLLKNYEIGKFIGKPLDFLK
jgi:hypothetical protein